MGRYGMKVIDNSTKRHLFTLDKKPGLGESLWCGDKRYRIINITDHPRICYVEEYFDLGSIYIKLEVK